MTREVDLTRRTFFIGTGALAAVALSRQVILDEHIAVAETIVVAELPPTISGRRRIHEISFWGDDRVPTRLTLGRPQGLAPIVSFAIGPGGYLVWRAPQGSEIVLLDNNPTMGVLRLDCEPAVDNARCQLFYDHEGRYFVDTIRWVDGEAIIESSHSMEAT